MWALSRHSFLLAVAPLAVALIGLAPGMLAAEEIRWQTDLQAARRLAAQTNRLVLVHFWATWCKPCMKLEGNVFNQPGIGRAIEANYVPVKVEFEDPIREQFNVQTIPTDVIITPQGEVLQRMTSPQSPRHYLARMDQIAADARQTRPELYAAAPRSAPPDGRPAPQYAANSRNPPQPNAGRYADRNVAAPYNADRYRTADRYAAAPAAPYGQERGAPQPPPYGSPSYSSAPQPRVSPTQPRYANQATTEWSQAGDSPQDPARQDAGRQDLVLQPPTNAARTAPETPNRSEVWVPDNQTVSSRRQPIDETPPESRYNRQPQPVVDRYTGYAPRRDQPLPAGRAVAGPPLGQALANAAAQGNPAAQARPAGNPPLALDGYCPVHLAEKQQWVKGDPKWGVIHRGRTYLFTTKSCQQAFWANPDRYSPVLGGDDPVLAKEQGVNTPGRREFGVFFGSRVVLFASDESRKKFETSPTMYVSP